MAITFTVMKRQYGLTIYTNSIHADLADKEIEITGVMLFHEMTRLSKKYNERDIAVVFDVE